MTKPAIGYAIAAAIGGVIGLVVGHFAQGDEFSFSFWFFYKQAYLGPWPIVGAIIGAGLRYLALNR